MTRYVSEPVAADSASIRAIQDASLAAAIPGIQVPAGTLLDVLLDTFSNTSAQDRQLLTEVLAIIFRYSGEKIDRVPQRDAVTASGFTTWTRTAVDATAARTVPAGTEITLDGLDGSPVAFQTTADFTFVAPSSVAGVTVANPAVITTTAAHGLASGQTVVIAGVGGATAVNGTLVATVLTTTTFSVPVNNTVAWTSGGSVSHTGTAAASVGVAAVLPGVAGNGLQTNPDPSQTSPWFASIAVSAPTSGGVDAEEDDAYLDRLADTRPLQATTIVKAADLARFLRNQTGIERAGVLNNFDASTNNNSPGHLTFAGVTASGTALGSTLKASVLALAQANTHMALAVHAIDPTFNTITVAFTGKMVAAPQYSAADVEARAEQAVLDFLNPAFWGRPQSGDQRELNYVPTIRFQDIDTVLNNVEGLDYWTTLTINGGTADVVMTGPFPLPAPSPTTTANGTITA